MNFENAMKELLEGKKIRRKEWEPFMHLKIIDDLVQTFRGENIEFFADAKVLISTGWRLFGDGNGCFDFVHAVAELKLNKTVTHEMLEGGYLFIDHGKLAICRPIQYSFMPTFKDLCSNDWEIMK